MLLRTYRWRYTTYCLWCSASATPDLWYLPSSFWYSLCLHTEV